jgi:hypothetical protein
MKLQVVWRNPSQLTKPEHSIEKISSDEFRALYAVIGRDHTQEFEVIPGKAA